MASSSSEWRAPRSPNSLSLDSLSFPVAPSPRLKSSVTHSTRSQWHRDSHILPVSGGCGMQRGHNRALLDESKREGLRAGGTAWAPRTGRQLPSATLQPRHAFLVPEME